jgi:cell division protein FtsI/penicillin-binding protein 2
MVYRTQLRRLIVFSTLLLLGFSVLLGRLVYIQVYRHDELSAKAFKYTQRTYLKQTRRGDIVDRNGSLLASTERLKILCADPSKIGDYYPALAKILAERLNLDENSLRERLRPREYTNSAGKVVIDPHVRLRSRVTEEEWGNLKAYLQTVKLADEEQLDEAGKSFLVSLRRWGVFTEPVDSHRRVYLNGELAAHVLGFVQTQERSVGSQTVPYASGRAGIESTFDEHLQGVLGWRTTETDSRRREQVALRSMDVDPVDGLNVHLTIDAGVQAIVEEELKRGVDESTPLTATVIVAQPHTGAVLAMANYPTYDPNHPGDYPVRNRRNRAISDQIEPGSTFKIVSVASAIESQVVNLNSRFDCENGHIYFMGRSLHDDHRYSILTVKEILKKSSNIGAFKIAQRLGPEKLYAHLKQFGIGDMTGIGLPAEVKGKLRATENWSGLSISRIPIGYEISVTPLQITMAMCAVANGGWLMSPMLIEGLSDPRGKTVMTYRPDRIRRVLSKRTARDMTEALETVVEEGGTAPRARMEHYTVAGKTGTARKFISGEGYSARKYYASFIGFFPSERPEVVISVIFNEPKGSIYGGVISGPVFKAIGTRLANYLNITPSQDLKFETRKPSPVKTADYARR